jgi:hypothetical protein
MVLVGYMLLAYSPLVALFVLGIAGTPRYVIVFIISTCFWLFHALLASLVWYLSGESLRHNLYYAVALGVTFQELGRCLLCFLYSYVKQPLSKLAPNPTTPYMTLQYGGAIGLAYGAMSTLMYSINVLQESYGPGTYYLPTCPHIPFFLVTGNYPYDELKEDLLLLLLSYVSIIISCFYVSPTQLDDAIFGRMDSTSLDSMCLYSDNSLRNIVLGKCQKQVGTL